MTTTSPRRRRIRTIAVTAIAATLAIPASHLDAAPDSAPERDERAAARRAPSLRFKTVLDGLDIPWDISFTPKGRMLVTERSRGRIMTRSKDGVVKTLVTRVPNLWSSGETGLMGITVDRDWTKNRRFYTCQGYEFGSYHDVRVVAWKANAALTSARRMQTLVKGMPVSSGRHGGCRLRLGGSGALFVGTGDAALTGTSRDTTSLGGKVLRVNRLTGKSLPTNPFINSSSANARKVWTYGHRNVQGLALRPSDGRMWSGEHGTNRDDEVNLLAAGGDYGWQPGPGYDESRPMTDHSLPGTQRDAKWSSGFPTIAPSGATWLRGGRWGSWEGALAVAVLKDESMRIMRFGGKGNLLSVANPAALDGTFGRVRTAELGPNNVLYITTSNGGGNDRVIAVGT